MRSAYKVSVDNHSQDIGKYTKIDFKRRRIWKGGGASGFEWIHLTLEHEHFQLF